MLKNSDFRQRVKLSYSRSGIVFIRAPSEAQGETNLSYQPKFCCECREKIDRKEWRPWTSPRFCELCDTNFGINDKIRLGALVFLTLLSFIGVANMFRQPEKQLAVSSNQLFTNPVNTSRQTVSQNNSSANFDKSGAQNPPAVKPAAVSEQPKSLPLNPNQQSNVKQSQTLPAASPEEIVYFCGARTKKGTPCTRRVKEPGRCWQHVGQPAMLPQQKLIASR